VIMALTKKTTGATHNPPSKANPNWGLRLIPRRPCRSFRTRFQNPLLQNAYRTKTLDEWMNVGVGLFNNGVLGRVLRRGRWSSQSLTPVCRRRRGLARKIDLASRCKVFTEFAAT